MDGVAHAREGVAEVWARQPVTDLLSVALALSPKTCEAGGVAAK